MANFYSRYSSNGFSSSSNPDYPAALSKIQNMTNAELQELLSDDIKCDQLLKSLDQVSCVHILDTREFERHDPWLQIPVLNLHYHFIVTAYAFIK